MTVLLRHMLEEANDPWVKSWMNIQKDVGVITSYERKHVLVEAMADRAVKHVIRLLQSHTLEALPQPWKSFFFQYQMSITRASKALCQVRGGNAQLGNRYPNRYGTRHVWYTLFGHGGHS